MNRILIFATLALTATSAHAQGSRQWRESTVVPIASADWTGARLPDGQPDVQGHWSNTIGNHNNLTNPQGGQGDNAAQGGQQNAAGRQGGARQQQRAPSRVSDPVDGQIPYQPWARAKQQEFAAHLNNPIKPEYVEPFARCAPGGPTKSFMWHGYEIRQYPGYVVFFFDSGTRVIHLSDTPHLPDTVKLWNGDSRGRWEGNTLIVDVANNNSKARFSRTGEFVSENATIKERYVFDAAGERFLYEATYTDPTVLTRPFTITIPNKRVTEKTEADGWNNVTFRAKHAGPEPIIEAWERTCVENNGNHGDVAATP